MFIGSPVCLFEGKGYSVGLYCGHVIALLYKLYFNNLMALHNTKVIIPKPDIECFWWFSRFLSHDVITVSPSIVL